MSKKWIRIYCTDREGTRYNEGTYGEDSDWQNVWHGLVERGHTVTVTVTKGSVQLKNYALAGSDLVLNDKAKQIEILMEGVQGAAMQSYAEQLSEVDIAAVITYTRKAWGNDASGDGEIVIPKEILDYKNNKL
jgi:hypothetical protein